MRGTEDRRKLAAACVLTGFAVLLILQWVFREGSPASTSVIGAAIEPATTPRPAAIKKAKHADSLDPMLRTGRLESIERKTYEGTGRNIFSFYAEEPKEKALPKPSPQPTPPALILPMASAIRLKFFGVATASNLRPKVCFSQDGDVFIGGEGDIIGLRYQILRIGSNVVEIADLLEHREHTLTLKE
jgi:hypothetical protein